MKGSGSVARIHQVWFWHGSRRNQERFAVSVETEHSSASHYLSASSVVKRFGFSVRILFTERDDDRFMFDEQENDPYAARAERDLAPYAASPQQENEPYMAPSEVACYECDSTVDGAMCYDSTLITKESRMCGLNSTSGGACAVRASSANFNSSRISSYVLVVS